MTDPDPDDAPTRFGGNAPKPSPGGDDPTVPAFERQRAQPGGTPAPKPAPKSAPGEDATMPALDRQRAQPGGTPAPKPAAKSEPGEEPTMPALERKPAKAGGPPPPAGAQKPGAAKPGAPKPGAEPPPPPPAAMADPLLGKNIGGCRIDKLLGRGAMGAVYKARQTKLDRDVAVKVIRPEMMTDQRMLKRFEVEARTVGKFNSAHVVMVHDVGFEHGVHYLVMEFVQGKNLRDHVKLLAGGRLPVGEALPMLRQAIKGLEEAQRLEVIHRDIKPDNLMVTDRGVLKIADFGIAKPLQEDFSMTLTSELVGTPLYMSPEQCQGEAELDFRSDMYSLGATFYYLLTGEPPIRASSVYELIQTKTKLAHLCLWKALPGLEENNPLSRVIERMTSLDRDDRYETYEGLLNDLVLVEQGQTITVPVAGSGKRGKAAPGRGRWIAIAAAVLLAAGGGVWFATRPATPGVIVADSPKGQLGLLRTRLVSEGPNKKLRGDIDALKVPDELAAEKKTLLGECDSGVALADALQAIGKPKKLVLPFEDLRLHFDAVAKAAKDHPVTGEGVKVWSEGAVRNARNEEVLAPLAREALASAWSTWQTKRAKAASPQARAGLGPELSAIESARANLAVLLPSGDAGMKPTQAEIDEARRDLTKASDVVVAVDVSKELQEVRDALDKAGPSDDLMTKLQKLEPSGEQVAARKQLLNEVGEGLRTKQNANKHVADQLNTALAAKLPFDDVAKYWDGLDGSLRPVRAQDGKLPPWAEAFRVENRREAQLRDNVVKSLTVAWRDCQKRTDAADAEQQLAAVRAAKVRAKELFGADIEGALEVAVPDKDLDAAANTLARVGMKTRWQADAETLNKQLAGVASLSEWSTASTGAGESLTKLTDAAKALGDDADCKRELKRLGDTVDRWHTAQKRIGDIDKRLGNGEVKAATALAQAGAKGAEGRDDFQLALDVVTACDKAFAGLEKSLAVEAAQQELDAVYEGVSKAPCLGATEKRLATWRAALGKLAEASRGMIAIPAGTPKGGNAKVDAFFLAPTECSRAEFAQFVESVRAAVKGIDGAQQRFDAVSARFVGTGMTPDRLRDLLERELRTDKKPMESVSWYTAAACAAWTYRALPTADEWTLAAFGDGGTNEFPWGNGWSNEPGKRNTSNTEAVDVDAGGLSWRSSGDRRLHHLAGNVAEWLDADAASPEGRLAGGRFNDSDATAKQRAAGSFEPNQKADGRRGIGFRTVLRVRSFPGLAWPK